MHLLPARVWRESNRNTLGMGRPAGLRVRALRKFYRHRQVIATATGAHVHDVIAVSRRPGQDGASSVGAERSGYSRFDTQQIRSLTRSDQGRRTRFVQDEHGSVETVGPVGDDSPGTPGRTIVAHHNLVDRNGLA